MNSKVGEQEMVDDGEGLSTEVLAGDTDAASNPPKEADDNHGNDETLFSDLVADEDFEEEGQEPEVETKVTEEPSDPQVSQEEQPQVPQEPAPQQTAQEPPQQSAQTPGAEGAGTPTDINAQYEEFFNKSVDVLADHVYKFDEQTAEELDTNPSKVMPKLAARLHMQVLTAAITQVANSFPALMQVHEDRHKEEKESEEKFFSEFPLLKEHKQTVQRVAQVYHSMYPNDPYEVRAPKIAAMAMIEAKVPLPGTQPQQPVVSQPPIPTSARGGTPAAAPKVERTLWEDLVEED